MIGTINKVKINDTIPTMYRNGQLIKTAYKSDDIIIGQDNVDYSEEYFTIVSLENNNLVQIQIPYLVDSDSLTSMSYSLDKDTWQDTQVDSTDQLIRIILNAGQKAYVKGTGISLASTHSEGTNLYKHVHINPNKKVAICGNIMSLIYGDSFIGKTSFPSQYTSFAYLCQGPNYVDAKNVVLPSLTLTKECYKYMFNTTSITKAPYLPATTLAESCYEAMFLQCYNLRTFQDELPALSLEKSCYKQMFYNCTSLVAAPDLPSTSLANSCYSHMFFGCSAILHAPELPATTLKSNCYEIMFNGCSSLLEAPELPATTLADYCYSMMFQGCTSMSGPVVLPAYASRTECYADMFNRCYSLTDIACLLESNVGAFRNIYLADSGIFRKSPYVPESAWRAVLPAGWTIVDYVE